MLFDHRLKLRHVTLFFFLELLPKGAAFGTVIRIFAIVAFDAPEAFGLLGHLIDYVIKIIVFHVQKYTTNSYRVINKKPCKIITE